MMIMRIDPWKAQKKQKNKKKTPLIITYTFKHCEGQCETQTQKKDDACQLI